MQCGIGRAPTALNVNERLHGDVEHAPKRHHGTDALRGAEQCFMPTMAGFSAENRCALMAAATCALQS
eukprot:8789281-Pyramimonas_sp.AAC.1